jgi:hypothetical protein
MHEPADKWWDRTLELMVAMVSIGLAPDLRWLETGGPPPERPPDDSNFMPSEANRTLGPGAPPPA